MGDAFKFIAAVSTWFIMVTAAAGADSQPPAEGGVFPDIVLSVPKSPEHQQYLGIAGKDTFKIPEIKAEVVLIEIFSMY